MKNEQYSTPIIWISFLACFLSNISQLPYFVTSGKTQIVCFPMWLVLFVVLLIKSHGRLSRKVMTFFGMALLFFLGVFINTMITGNDYFSSSLLYSFIISIFIFLVGALSSSYFDDLFFDKITVAYFISTLIVSTSVFFTYFGFGYSLNTRVYAYASKNSFAQIIFVAIVLLLCTYNPEKRIMKLFKWSGMLFELFLIILLRSRATLLSLVVVVFFMAISRNTSKKLKLLISTACVALFVLLLANNNIYDLVLNNIIFAGRDASSLDSLSSGRMTILASFPVLLDGHWLVGIGSKYFECFPLSSILQFGLLSGIVLIIISLYPVVVGWANRKREKHFDYLFLIAVGFAIDGLFEGLTPFGPGIKCYYLWYLFGVLICKKVEDGVVEYGQ